MRFLVRALWKCIPKQERNFLLERLPAHERQGVNKVLSGNKTILPGFQDRQCIFIHVPKCAGESLCRSLFDSAGPGHLPLSWYERVVPEFYSGAFKFAFVRDPLERAYSGYSYLQKDRGIARDNSSLRLARSYPDFDSFVKGWLCEENALRQIHFVPQWQFLVNGVGRLDVDFLGRQERLSEDFAAVCLKLGLQLPLEHINRSEKSGKSAWQACSEAARRRIYDVYRRDYELLGYTPR